MKKLLPMNLQYFAEGEGNEPEFSFDDFKAFAESNEDAQKFLKSQNQSAADKQLESWQKNNLDKIKQDAIKDYEESKKNKTPDQIKLEELQAEMAAEKALRITSENKAFVAEQISGLELDGDLKESVSKFMLNNLVSDNSEFTKSAVEAFTGVLGTIKEQHAASIKELEMKSAFGNKQQNSTGSQKEQSTGDPMEALSQGINNLIS
ncbi:capsid assembly scaffolding protein Gp46 family protein [Enterococcus sp. AZ192]|uniref:capsid assembly scaffolding protein Gp46 family protein n=1 Tax=unclassified Enterococcus TaxID=2608891 RepID=UPI003D281061